MATGSERERGDFVWLLGTVSDPKSIYHALDLNNWRLEYYSTASLGDPQAYSREDRY